LKRKIFVPKRKQEQKLIWMGLVPLVAGAGWWIEERRRRRSLPRSRVVALKRARFLVLQERGRGSVREPIPSESAQGDYIVGDYTPGDYTESGPVRGAGGGSVSPMGVPSLVEDPSYRRYGQAEAGEMILMTGGEGRQPGGGGPAGDAKPLGGGAVVFGGAASAGEEGENPPRHQGETAAPGEEAPLAGHALETHTAENFSLLALLVPFLILALFVIALAFNRAQVRPQTVVPGGDVERGRLALQGWGCGSCHTISGVTGADSKVGPNLNEVGLHSFIAGHLENTPDNMVRWIQDPQDLVPGNAMPDTGVSESMARDMAAYLYWLGQRQGSEGGFNLR